MFTDKGEQLKRWNALVRPLIDACNNSIDFTSKDPDNATEACLENELQQQCMQGCMWTVPYQCQREGNWSCEEVNREPFMVQRPPNSRKVEHHPSKRQRRTSRWRKHSMNALCSRMITILIYSDIGLVQYTPYGGFNRGDVCNSRMWQ